MLADDSEEDEVLYCICRSNGEDNLPMILCEECEMWYHLHCLGFQPGDDELIDVFKCPACTERTGQKTSWRVKCSREECRHASRLPLSIYCSDACGIFLMSLKLRQINIHPDSVEQAGYKVSNYTNIPSLVFNGDGDKVSSVSLAANSKKQDCLATLTTLNTQITRYTNQIALLTKQESYHKLAVARAQSLSSHLLDVNQTNSPDKPKKPKGRGASIPKGYCGFDYRLLADDEDWEGLDVHQIENTPVETDALLCNLKESACSRHKEWRKMMEYKLQVHRSTLEAKQFKLQSRQQQLSLKVRHYDKVLEM